MYTFQEQVADPPVPPPTVLMWAGSTRFSVGTESPWVGHAFVVKKSNRLDGEVQFKSLLPRCLRKSAEIWASVKGASEYLC